MSKKAEVLQSKIEDVKSEAIDTISQAMEENEVEFHDFPNPLPYKQKDITGVKRNPLQEDGPFIEYFEAGIERDEEIYELDVDEILFILYNLEDEFEVN